MIGFPASYLNAGKPIEILELIKVFTFIELPAEKEIDFTLLIIQKKFLGVISLK